MLAGETKDKLRPYIFLAPAVLVIALITFYPLSYGFYVSFTDMTEKSYYGGTYQFVGLSNYIEAFQDPKFWDLLGWTVMWTVTNVVLHVVIGLCLALLLNRAMRLRGLYRTVYLLPWAIPTFISSLVWREIMYNTDFGVVNRGLEIFGASKINWIDTMPWARIAVIVANVWLGVPFMMMIFSAALQKIPKELYDAADVDGATRWQKIRHITLPYLKPTIAIASLLGFIWTFNMFNVIYLITGGGPAGQTNTLVTYVFNEYDLYGKMGSAAAVSVIIFFILLIISIIYLKVTKAMEAWY